MLLVFFVPFTRLGDGSAISAYADFPLAVFYLASVIYLLDCWKTKAAGALYLFGCLAGVLPWIKREGIILWLCLVALAIVKVAPARQLRSLLIVVLPGAITFTGWNLFIRLVHTQMGQDYLPFTLSTLSSNLGRLPEIVRVLVGEMLINWHFWSLLWPGVILALPLFISKGPRKQPVGLLLAVALPVILYSATYLFSSWVPFMGHVYTSLYRLLLQVSLVAILIIGLAVPLGSYKSSH